MSDFGRSMWISLYSTRNMMFDHILKCYAQKAIRMKSQRKLSKYQKIDKKLSYKLKGRNQKNATIKSIKGGYNIPGYIYDMNNDDITFSKLYAYEIPPYPGEK